MKKITTAIFIVAGLIVAFATASASDAGDITIKRSIILSAIGLASFGFGVLLSNLENVED